MNKNFLQRFDFKNYMLQYNPDTFILLCKKMPEGKNIWIRKIEDGGYIDSASCDSENFYISISYDDKSGEFIAIDKKNGKTQWSILGKSYMHQPFGNSIYLIFIDENDLFYLIKAKTSDGKKIWFYEVDENLCGYKINQDRVVLEYIDGRIDIIDSTTGVLLEE